MTARPWFSHAHARLLAWTTFVLVIILRGCLRYYLAPWNAYVATAGGVMLAALFLAGFAGKPETSGAERGNRKREWLLTMSHCVPLVLFVAVGPSMPGLAAVSHAVFMPIPPHPRGQSESAPKAASGEYLSVSIADLRSAPERFEGRPVEVIGRIHYITEEERSALPREGKGKNVRALLYRYAITCCVADAVPLSVVLADIDPETLPDDAWYRVRGYSHYEGGALDIPFLRVESLQPVPEPANPYLSATDEVFR